MAKTARPAPLRPERQTLSLSHGTKLPGFGPPLRYGDARFPGSLSPVEIKFPVFVYIKVKILFPGAAGVIPKKLRVALEQVRVLLCKVMGIAEKHLKITRCELRVVLEHIRMPDR